MAKVRENFRVICDLDERYRFGRSRKEMEGHWKREAEALKEQIKRHCDASVVYVEWSSVCEHCGRTWEEDPATKEPVCCDKAQAEFAASKVPA